MAEEKALAVTEATEVAKEKEINRTDALARRPELDELLRRMATLDAESSERKKKYNDLKKQVIPLVKVLGGSYTTPDGIKGSISVSTYWYVTPASIKSFIEYFQELMPNIKDRIYQYLRLDPTSFSELLKSRILGEQSEILQRCGIERKVGSSSFRLSYKGGGEEESSEET